MKRLYSFIACLFFSFSCFSQTVLIDPNAGGGFESGSSFLSNGWVPVNGAANQWAVGTGSFLGTQGAYIGDATTFAGVNSAAVNHFYSSSLYFIPATATDITLSFRIKMPVVDAGYDSVIVAFTSSGSTPFAGVHLGASYTYRYFNTATIYADYTPITLSLPSLAGTSTRFIFTYVNDGFNPIGVPAIDSISLTYCNVGTITGISTICQGGSTVFSDPVSGPVWSSSDTDVATVSSSGLVSGITDGTAVISYSSGSCNVTKVINVSTPSPAAITGLNSVCEGNNITLSDATPGGVWSIAPSSVASIGSSGLVTGITGGTAIVSYTQGGCRAIATVTVNPTFTPSVSITPDGAGVCAGAPVTFTATPVNGGTTPSYQWSVNGSPMGLDLPTYTYSPADGDIVSATLTPGGICVDPLTADDTYTVTLAPTILPSVDVVVNPGNPSCMGKPVTFSAVPVGGGSAPTYLWTKNSVHVATGPSFMCTPADGDIILCTMTSNYDCRLADEATSSNITMTVQVGEAAPEVAITALPGTLISSGQMVSFTATAAGGTTPLSYMWYINGTPVSGATSASFESNTLNNGDIVTCRVANTDVCANSTLKSVTVTVAGLGVNNMDAVNSISVFPNPNKGSFFIRGAFAGITDKEASAVITNILGEVVYSILIPVKNGNLDQQVILDQLAPGIYTVNIHSDTENKVAHFVVQ